MATGKKVLEKLAALYATHPVAICLLPMMDAAMDSREKSEREDIEALRIELEAAGWDSKLVAPYPKNSYSRDYFTAKGKYDFCGQVTRSVKGSHSFNEPHTVVMSEEGIKRYISDARLEAADYYLSFVYKLCAKTGKVETATITGNHVWSYSILTITKADGTVEKWQTNCILNRSKYNKLFNQWPSRKLKAAK